MTKLKIDLWLAIPSFLLLSIGILLLSITAPELAKMQLLFLGVSVLGFVVFSQTSFPILKAVHPYSYIASLIFLLLPLFIGLVSRGATRWIQIGSISLQPSELIKPFLLVTYAAVAVSNLKYKEVALIGLLTLPAFLTFIQPDLGTTLVIFVGWFIIFLSRVSLKIILSGVICLGLLALPAYKFVLHDYQRDRLITFLNPYQDPLDKGYHVIQSIIAVGSGQISGRGLGHGTQSQLQFLPENHTDFIFASVSESFGFLGSTIVVSLYLTLLWRIYKISQLTNDPAYSMFCLAFMGMTSFQIFINIGMNIGLVPVTGITLPLLSYGGSSLLSFFVGLGMINSVSVSRSNLV